MVRPLFIFFSLSLLQFSLGHNWNEFHLTWPKFPSVPIDPLSASKAGWSLDTDCSKDKQYGARYFKDGEKRAASLLFNNLNQLSGLQTCLSTTHPFAKSMMAPEGPMELLSLDNTQYYCATMYFRDPASICDASGLSSNATGDGLWLGRGSGAPLKLLEDIHSPPGAPWVKGKCFKTMGVHYWYNFTADTACDAIFPVFLLYNGGSLNAWGWVFPTNPVEDGGNRFENPTGPMTKLFLPENPANQPSCVFDSSLKALSTMHVAHNNPFLSNFC